MATSFANGPMHLRSERLPEDEDFLLCLFAEARAHIFRAMPLPPEQKRMLVGHQFRAQRLSYQNQYVDPPPAFRIIERDGVAIGRLYTHETAGDIRIVDIALMPEWRGQGLGTTLLQELIGRAHRAGKTVSLSVDAENPARSLYERLGFKCSAFNDPHWQMVCPPPHG